MVGKVDDKMDIKRKYSVSSILTTGQVCQLLTSGLVNNLPISSGKALGIVQVSTGMVLLKGISKVHTGLVPGTKYYYDTNGVISTTNTGTFIGYALSTTEIYIPNYIIS
jgi:hypothetical protein